MRFCYLLQMHMQAGKLSWAYANAQSRQSLHFSVLTHKVGTLDEDTCIQAKFKDSSATR